MMNSLRLAQFAGAALVAAAGSGGLLTIACETTQFAAAFTVAK